MVSTEKSFLELHLANAGWVDKELEQFAFDVDQFLPNFFIYNCTLTLLGGKKFSAAILLMNENDKFGRRI